MMDSASLQLEFLWIAAAYLLVVNAWEFVLFAWDKSCARNGRWRVSENMLLTIALIGGSPGAMIGQRLLRHKTRKQPFRTHLLTIVVLQAAAIIVAAFLAFRGAAVLPAG